VIHSGLAARKDDAAQQRVVDSRIARGIDMPKTEIDRVEDGGNFRSLPWVWSAMMREGLYDDAA
jgi:hypothetical protein